ncbi:MAG: hypothetical protein LBV23_09645, partial [Deltaproteobacteria bacterium]|nr:hypothetical protein [Deltaproteobacteria bacterium]
GTPDIVFIWPEKALYAIIELKYESTVDDTNIEKKLTQLAQKALKTIDTKDYWRPYKVQAKNFNQNRNRRGQSWSLPSPD